MIIIATKLNFYNLVSLPKIILSDYFLPLGLVPKNILS